MARHSFGLCSTMPFLLSILAERAGFEPARLIAYTISNRAHSTGLCDLSAMRALYHVAEIVSKLTRY